MSKKSEFHSALAAAMRKAGLPVQEPYWSEAKKMVAEGLSMRASVRLVLADQTPEFQAQAKARAAKATKATKATKGKGKKVIIAPEPDAPAAKAIPVQAQRVKAGAVLRDERGRILSRKDTLLRLLAEVNA